MAKPLPHCVLWFSSFSSSPTTQSGISSITLLVLALISKLSLVFYSKKAPDVSFLCLKLQLPVLAVSYVYVYMSHAEGAESPQKKTDSCPCYRHVQSASQYLLSPLPAKTQICLDIHPSVKPKSKWSGWAQPLTSGCRKEKERGSHLLGAPIKVSSVPLIGLARFGTEKRMGSHCQCPATLWNLRSKPMDGEERGRVSGWREMHLGDSTGASESSFT